MKKTKSFSLFLGMITLVTVCANTGECVKAMPQETSILQENAQATAEDSVPKMPSIAILWHPGDRWTVESRAIQKQNAGEEIDSPRVLWEFTVGEIEKIRDQDCFRVRIVCKDHSRQQPEIQIWVNCQTGMLLQLESKMFIHGKWRSFSETYVTPNGNPVPVFGAIPALPLDMPIFNPYEGQTKSLTPTTCYQVIPGNSPNKDIDEICFIRQTHQTIQQPTESFIKTLNITENVNDMLEIWLDSADHKVGQIWMIDKPWPILSNNGTTEARLVEFVSEQTNKEK